MKILRIKRGCYPLLLVAGGHENRITLIVVMKVKRHLVVPATVRIPHFSDGGPSILDHHFGIGDSPAIAPAYKPFYGEPMVNLMLRLNSRQKRADAHNRNGGTQRCTPEPRAPRSAALHPDRSKEHAGLFSASEP